MSKYILYRYKLFAKMTKKHENAILSPRESLYQWSKAYSHCKKI